MRKLIVGAFVTLDGVMQAPGGPDEDRSGGFDHGGWVVPHSDETTGKFIDEMFAEPFDLLLGRKTYDIFAAYWPHAGRTTRSARCSTASPNMSPPAAVIAKRVQKGQVAPLGG